MRNAAKYLRMRGQTRTPGAFIQHSLSSVRFSLVSLRLGEGCFDEKIITRAHEFLLLEIYFCECHVYMCEYAMCAIKYFYVNSRIRLRTRKEITRRKGTSTIHEISRQLYDQDCTFIYATFYFITLAIKTQCRMCNLCRFFIAHNLF